MNQLYWGPGMKTTATYNRFGRDMLQPNLFPDKLADLRGAVLKVTGPHLLPLDQLPGIIMIILNLLLSSVVSVVPATLT